MSNIADKISKLIAKADSTTHPEEADAFMAKVHSLLEQHGMSLLEVGKLQSDDPVGVDRDAAVYDISISGLRDVVFNLARYYGCEALIARTMDKNKRRVRLIGRDSARITFQLMLPYVIKQSRKAARELVKEQGSTETKQLRFVNNALSDRLIDMILEQKRRDRANNMATKGVNALVPVDLIQQAMDENFKNVKEARETDSTTTLAAMRKANEINLDAQVAKGGAKLKQIGAR